ncbi:MAG: hypothetical protein HY863_07765 [Chloroflexi bacterium]|nr:hypothetical protein [Chloroflexota bacterium]
MERFIVESPHLIEDCDRVIQDLHAAGYLHHFEWGCKDNEHTGWAIVEAESLEHAKQIVPWYVRNKARIVRLVKFEVADEEHKKRE